MVENALLKRKGKAFEDLFSNVSKHHWGEDFEPWKPQGRFGDFKCDGFWVPEKTVFQCHAPEQQIPSETKSKILRDFSGAKEHFGADLKKWVFVHNLHELPAGCGDLLKDLRRDNNEIELRCWLLQDIPEFILRLDPNKLAIVFPELLSVGEEDVSKQRSSDVSVVADLAASQAPNNEGGTDRLDQVLVDLGVDDIDIRRRILGSCVWLDPMPIVRGFNLLKERGYDDPAIDSNLHRLKSEGFVQVTSSHILPKDREVCQEAANILADEFIELLRAQ